MNGDTDHSEKLINSEQPRASMKKKRNFKYAGGDLAVETEETGESTREGGSTSIVPIRGINGSSVRDDSLEIRAGESFDMNAQQRNRLNTSDSLVDATREFVPAVDESVYKKGSFGNKQLTQRMQRKEHQEKIQAAADECTKLINKNLSAELIKYLKTLPADIKMNKILDKEGYTLLHMAAFQNRTGVVFALL